MAKRRKTRLKHLGEKVQKGERIIGMECHDTPSAIMAEELGMDLLCCGSPGPMGLMGHKSMATVDFEEQLYMLEGVLRGASSPFIICNMPNTTASISIEQSVRNAAKVVKLGADGVHIEPSLGTVEHIRAIVAAGIPVVGHFGVQGERAVMNSGHTPAGRTAEEAKAILELVHASIDAGIFAALFEHTSVELTKYCYENLPIAVASLGSGPHAHGIFHVSSDIIGCSVFPIPPKREVFGDVWGEMEKAYAAYFKAASGGQFPKPELSHNMHDGELAKFLESVG
ncbi:3-methyl-2-oxobutanoate hydroxymethyltransferase [Rhodobacteraceae bacterium LMO-12]|nr:3-methyl-2-oxobutanoate hydroxymethyltransferase [Rhodobacteraceae bacterium LMO-JJ12]